MSFNQNLLDCSFPKSSLLHLNSEVPPELFLSRLPRCELLLPSEVCPCQAICSNFSDEPRITKAQKRNNFRRHSFSNISTKIPAELFFQNKSSQFQDKLFSELILTYFPRRYFCSFHVDHMFKPCRSQV